MRRIDRRWSMAFVLLMLLGMPAAGWARVFYYTQPYYFFLPIQLQFADRDTGDPIGRSSNMIMYGGQTREFAIDAVDFNRNGVIDIRDFKVFNVTYTVSLDINISGDIISSDSPWVVSLDVPIPPDLGDDAKDLLALKPHPNPKEYFDKAMRNSVSGAGFFHLTSTTENLLDATLDTSNLGYYGSPTDPKKNPPNPLPRRVALCRVTPRQQPGDRGSAYNEQFAQFKYTIYWGQRAALDDDNERKKLTTRAETPEMSITIRATDQGGKGGDNGGGSCDALALGAVSLLIPGLLLRRRTK